MMAKARECITFSCYSLSIADRHRFVSFPRPSRRIYCLWRIYSTNAIALRMSFDIILAAAMTVLLGISHVDRFINPIHSMGIFIRARVDCRLFCSHHINSIVCCRNLRSARGSNCDTNTQKNSRTNNGPKRHKAADTNVSRAFCLGCCGNRKRPTFRMGWVDFAYLC